MDAMINGIPLMVIVLGLVEFAKQLGLQGKASLVLSMFLGILFGVLYQLSVTIPADMVGWLSAVVYGLALGLSASGLYDLGKRYTAK